MEVALGGDVHVTGGIQGEADDHIADMGLKAEWPTDPLFNPLWMKGRIYFTHPSKL